MSISRILFSELLNHLKYKDGVAIIGPRRIGKSFLLGQIREKLREEGKKNLLYNLDDLELRIKMTSESNFLIHEAEMNDADIIMIDEAQKLPQIFEQIKMLLDQKKIKAILSGSSSLEIRQKTAETFGGRVRMLRMFPFVNAEVSGKESFIQKFLDKKRISLRFFQSEQKRLWTFKDNWERNWKQYLTTGFLPEVFLEKNQKEKFLLIKDFVQNYLEKDVLLLSRVLRIEDFRRALGQFAFQNGQILNTIHLSTESGFSRKTIQNYFSLLKNTFIINQIQALSSKKRSSIFKSPKIYFFDVGIANYLLGLSSFDQIEVAKRQGAVAETYVLSQVLPYTENQAPPSKLSYWRSYQGHEVDFVIEKGNRIIPIEVTLSDKIKGDKVKNFQHFFDLANASYGIILYQGELRRITIDNHQLFAIPLWMWI